jgi:O-antigen/teichoic acid export membrane protein
LSIGQILSGVLYFIAIVFIARSFGAGKFGVFSFAEASFFFFSLIVLFGTDIIGMREISKAEKKDKAAIVNSVVSLRSLFCLSAFFILSIFIIFLKNSLETKLVILICVSAIFSLVFLLDWFFWGEERFVVYSFFPIIRDLFFFLGVLFLINFKASFLWVGVVFLISKLLGSGFLLVKYSCKYGFPGISWDKKLDRQFFASSAMMFATALVGWIVGYFNIFVISFFVGESGTGLYSAAYKPISFVLLAIMVGVKSIFPYLSKSAMTRKSDFRKIVIFALLGIAVLFTPLMLLGNAVSSEIMGLIYGSVFIESGKLFYFLIFAAFIIAINTVYSRSLVAAGEDRSNFIANISVGVINIIASLISVYKWGIVGAAFSMIIGDGIVFFYYHWKLSKIMRIPLLKIAIVPISAMVISTMFVFLLKLHINHFLGLIINGGIYFIIACSLVFILYRHKKNFLLKYI